VRNCPDCGDDLLDIAKSCRCGWKAPAQPYRATPTKMPEYSTVQKNFDAMRDTKRRTKTVFLPGESFNDYQSALFKSGKQKSEFDNERMRMNGF
jgi:hypothetical protein